MKDSLNFSVQYYFPGRFIWVLVMGFTSVATVATNHYLLGLFAFLIGIIALTMKYGVEINLASKKYKEYVWLLGIKQGQYIPFQSIQYFFIKDFKVSQRVNSRIKSATFIEEEFRGFVKFDDDEKIHLLTKKNKEALIQKLKSIAQDLQVGLIDYSYGKKEKLL